MSYFSTRRDYGFIVGIIAYENTYLQAYHKLISFMEQNQMWLVPIGRLADDKQPRNTATERRIPSQT
jgi:hypothetical protein